MPFQFTTNKVSVSAPGNPKIVSEFIRGFWVLVYSWFLFMTWDWLDQWPGMTTFVSFARRVEREVYEAASSGSEYCHLLVVNVYNIQEKIAEEGAQRRQQQRAQQQQQFFSVKVPKWAEDPELFRALRSQQEINPDDIFYRHHCIKPENLIQMFPQAAKQRDLWNSPIRSSSRTINPVEFKAKENVAIVYNH